MTETWTAGIVGAASALVAAFVSWLWLQLRTGGVGLSVWSSSGAKLQAQIESLTKTVEDQAERIRHLESCVLCETKNAEKWQCELLDIYRDTTGRSGKYRVDAGGGDRED